jgi:hypothetical protein
LAAIEESAICRRSRSRRSPAPKLSSVTTFLGLLAAPLLADCTHVDPTLPPCTCKSMSGERQKAEARNDVGGNDRDMAHEIARGLVFVAPCKFGSRRDTA